MTGRRGADHGPREPLARGERVVELAPDPGRPNATIRRARATWLPLEMHARGALSRAGLEAATRYRDDVELASRAQERPRDPAAWVRVDGGGGRCPTQAVLDAARRVAAAEAAAGTTGAVVLRLAVASGATRQALARAIGCSERSATGYLAAVLDRLADHYACG